MEEEKERIIKVYQERWSMHGVERSHGICRQAVSAWLKEKSEQLPSLWGDVDTYRSRANTGVGARWTLFLCLQQRQL